MKKRLLLVISLLILAFGFVSCNMSINSVRPKTVYIVNNDGYCQSLLEISPTGGTTFYTTNTKFGVYSFKNIEAKYYCRYYVRCRISGRNYVSEVEVTEDLLKDYDDDKLYIEVYTDSQKRPSVKVHKPGDPIIVKS